MKTMFKLTAFAAAIAAYGIAGAQTFDTADAIGAKDDSGTLTTVTDEISSGFNEGFDTSLDPTPVAGGLEGAVGNDDGFVNWGDTPAELDGVDNSVAAGIAGLPEPGGEDPDPSLIIGESGLLPDQLEVPLEEGGVDEEVAGIPGVGAAVAEQLFGPAENDPAPNNGILDLDITGTIEKLQDTCTMTTTAAAVFAFGTITQDTLDGGGTPVTSVTAPANVTLDFSCTGNGAPQPVNVTASTESGSASALNNVAFTSTYDPATITGKVVPVTLAFADDSTPITTAKSKTPDQTTRQFSVAIKATADLSDDDIRKGGSFSNTAEADKLYIYLDY